MDESAREQCRSICLDVELALDEAKGKRKAKGSRSRPASIPVHVTSPPSLFRGRCTPPSRFLSEASSSASRLTKQSRHASYSRQHIKNVIGCFIDVASTRSLQIAYTSSPPHFSGSLYFVVHRTTSSPCHHMDSQNVQASWGACSMCKG